MGINPQTLPQAMLDRMSPADREALNVPLRDEQDFQGRVAAYLRSKKIVFNVHRMDRPSTGTVGQPDFTFAINGRPVALECKMPGNGPSAAQLKMIESMRANGWRVEIVYSMEAVRRVVEEMEGNQ